MAAANQNNTRKAESNGAEQPPEEKGETEDRTDSEGQEDQEPPLTDRPKGIGDMLATLKDDIRTKKPKPTYETNLGNGVLGLAPGRIVVLEGDSGTGKTSLAMSCVFELLYRHQDKRAVVVSVDISADELLEREAARLTRIPLCTIQDRALTSQQHAIYEKAHNHMETISDRLHISDRGLDQFTIVNVVDRFEADIVVIDYIQDLEYIGKGDRRNHIEVMLRTCKAWKRFGKTVIVMSEVTHNPTTGAVYPRESMEIRYSSDDEYLLKPAGEPKGGKPQVVNLIHLKKRRGPMPFKLNFWGDTHYWSPLIQAKEDAA